MAARINRRASEATRRKMSQSKRGVKNPMYHRRHTPEAKAKISTSLVKYWAALGE
ncbi:MAG: hypothetical protein J6I36_06925 [Bacteroidaceae bacterium]|nr:hypothetical protein [Bacteroidaceae bacterium]